MSATLPAAALVPVAAAVAISHNTLVVAGGVAAVGFAAGVAGCFAVLRRRALAGDAAAHATLVGVAAAFLATGRRDLPTLLSGAMIAAAAALGALVLIRRWTRTRDDAATALVLGVSFGAGVTLVSWITSRGLPGSAGLEQFLLGHTAGLTAADAALLGGLSAAVVAAVAAFRKEATLVAFDPAFAAAAGWPVTLVDYALVTLVAAMVVVGLPAAGVVLVTALVVIPPVAARQWTDRVGVLLPLAGAIGLAAALAGVAVSAWVPRMPTGPLVVIAAAVILGVSLVVAPRRGWLARFLGERRVRRAWAEGRALEGALELEREAGSFTLGDLLRRAPGGGMRGAVARLVRGGAIEASGGTEPGRFRLGVRGRELAAERRRRREAWGEVLEEAREEARGHLSIDLPAPEAVIPAARLKAIRDAAAAARDAAGQEG